MKKITLLLSFVVCAMFANAQTNLLANSSFETWESSVATGWTLQTPANGTTTAETVKIKDGSKSLKIVTTGTFQVWQVVPVTPGKTYTLSLSYYIESGDGTDARIWSNFKNGTAFLTNDELGTVLLNQLKGPDNLYFADEKGSWKTYNLEIVAPSMATDFAFEFRTYTAATVYWDNFFFGEKVTGLNTPSASKLELIVSGKNLLVKNLADGSEVEIFSAVGSKVLSAAVENGKVNIANLKNGMYVVRSGKKTQKIRL
jgi:hypothetical protein